MHSRASTPKEYLDELPEERRKAISKVRSVIRKHLPKGYKETMQYGMISYVVPLSRYPDGYLKRKDEPLPYISLASQKNHMAVYFGNLYSEKELLRWFENAYEKAGKKLDMGKSCVRFKKLENLPLDVIGKAVAATSVDDFISMYEDSRSKRKK